MGCGTSNLKTVSPSGLETSRHTNMHSKANEDPLTMVAETSPEKCIEYPFSRTPTESEGDYPFDKTPSYSKPEVDVSASEEGASDEEPMRGKNTATDIGTVRNKSLQAKHSVTGRRMSTPVIAEVLKRTYSLADTSGLYYAKNNLQIRANQEEEVPLPNLNVSPGFNPREAESFGKFQESRNDLHYIRKKASAYVGAKCYFCEWKRKNKSKARILRHHSLEIHNPASKTPSGCDPWYLPLVVCQQCRQAIDKRKREELFEAKWKPSQPLTEPQHGKNKTRRKDYRIKKSVGEKGQGVPPQPPRRRCARIDAQQAKSLRREAAGKFLRQDVSITDMYKFTESIGKGRFGTIYKATHNHSNNAVAIKKLTLSACQPEYILAELQCLVSQHPSFVRLIEVYEEGDTLWLVMDLMRTELLSELMRRGPFGEGRARVFTVTIAKGLLFMHRNLYVHRDLKPENILISYNDEFKLADFGLARQLKVYRGNQVEELSGTCGTWAYNAPEMRAKGERYGRSADIWSLGVILFIVLSGYHPFDPHGKGDKEKMLKAISRDEWSFGDKCWKRISDEAKDLISWMMARDPAERPTASEILQHPWFLATQELTGRLTRSEADANGNARVHKFQPSAWGSQYHSTASPNTNRRSSGFRLQQRGLNGGDASPTTDENKDLTAQTYQKYT